jgi:hypothetical protein
MQYSMELGPVMKEEIQQAIETKVRQERHIMEDVSVKLSNQ